MIRRISFSLFLIYEFHWIIYLFSLISWFKREQVIHIECFLCTIRNSSLINTVSADNNNSILVLMWLLILPSSSCFHESAIIRLLISSKKPNDKNMVWKKYIFILQMPSRTQQQQWLLSCTDILIYFIIWALHPSAFSGKATRWFSRKTHFKASDNRTGFLLFQIIVRLAPAVHLYSLCLFRMSFENVRDV